MTRSPELASILAALAQRHGQQKGAGAHPHARLARAMSGHDTQALRARYLPSPMERAQHGSSGYAHNYHGIPNEVAGGFQLEAFDNGAFQT